MYLNIKKLLNLKGTHNPPYSVHSEKKQNIAQPSNFHSISAMPQYSNFSFEVISFIYII